jgi:catechol 2,3-dioxygenase-like lactoylglutathione lyase family enzyme
MGPKTLDHVAYWIEGRDEIAGFLEQHVGMHVIDKQDAFTLIGSNARRGKLTLFDPREGAPAGSSALRYVALRVSDLAAARAQLPAGTPDIFDAGHGVLLTLVEAETDVDYDLDHVALWADDPEATAAEWERYGFARAGSARVEVGGAFIEFHEGRPESGSPLLNHIAVLVDSADEVVVDAKDLGIEVESVVDAANTYAAFLWGPEGVRIEYVEHKPTFSLT